MSLRGEKSEPHERAAALKSGAARTAAALTDDEAAPAIPGTGVTAVGTPSREAVPAGVRDHYVSVATKFTLAMTFTVLWVCFSVWISASWIHDLAPVTGQALAWTIVILVAYLPGAIVAFLTASLVLDRQPPLPLLSPTSALTVIIAARNEEGGIARTIAAISRTDYAGPVCVILADNGSTDGTCDAAPQGCCRPRRVLAHHLRAETRQVERAEHGAGAGRDRVRADGGRRHPAARRVAAPAGCAS